MTLLLVIKKEGNDSQRRIWRDFSDAVDVDRIHMRPVAGPIQHIPESLSTYEFSAYFFTKTGHTSAIARMKGCGLNSKCKSNFLL